LLVHGQMFVRLLLLVCVIGWGAAPRVSAQDKKADGPPLPDFLADPEIDQGGGFHVSKHFAVVFGGIKQGSGIALGPAVSHEFADGSYAQLKGVYSLRQFKLVQARYDSRPLFGKRSLVSTRVRWQDAPELSLYRLGPNSPDLRAEYGERKTEWSGYLKTTVAPKTSLSVGAGLERYATSGGGITETGTDAPGEIPQTPGLGSRPWFVHSFVSIAQDSRLAPDFSRTGRLLEAGLHHYHDAHDGRESFRRVELAAEQLLPTGRRESSASEARGALGISARAWLSGTGGDRIVPFFLMPTLGGGNYLRGYATYRFRERNAVLLRAEYCWAVHKMVDVAGLYEAGTVSATVRGLSLSGMAQSVGGGIRVHNKTSGLLRVDLAGGRDGLKLSIGVSAGS
jgi:hypothetical protein